MCSSRFGLRVAQSSRMSFPLGYVSERRTRCTRSRLGFEPTSGTQDSSVQVRSASFGSMLAYDESFIELLGVAGGPRRSRSTLSRTPSSFTYRMDSSFRRFRWTIVPEDFPDELPPRLPARTSNGYVASINCFLAIDEFTVANGGTIVVPGTHQLPEQTIAMTTSTPTLCRSSVPWIDACLRLDAVACGRCQRVGSGRLAINQQFTRSCFKQQVDYVRALGEGPYSRQQSRTQQLLGWYTRVVTSLDDYYRPAEERLYRSGQG